MGIFVHILSSSVACMNEFDEYNPLPGQEHPVQESAPFQSSPSQPYPSQPTPPYTAPESPPTGYYPNFYGFSQPYQPPVPHKRGNGIKALLWGTAALMIVAAVVLIVTVMNSPYGRIAFILDSSRDEKIPFNSNSDTSYAADLTLPEAPNVTADLNGPQISALEESHGEIKNVVNAAFQKAAPSIVCITSYKAGTDFALTQSGEGSGIIITADGYIATNSHVVDDSKKTGVMITLSSGTQHLGTVIGIDKKTDLAVLKIDAQNLTPAEFANSDGLYVGQEAYAIGNPGGSKFSNSLTKGTVSALNRIVSAGYVKYIQTDAAINPGNSGGALINEEGQVIGMNTIKLVGTDYEGMGFAIPSNQVIEIINKLIKYGYVNDRGTLGIEGQNCTLYQSKTNNVPQGVVITKINTESPLYTTQVREKDIITAINGIAVKDFSTFIDELSKFHPDDEVTLTLFRVPAEKNTKPYSFDVSIRLMKDTGE